MGQALNSLTADKPVALGLKIELEFRNAGFRGEGSTRKKTSRSMRKDENQQTNSTHI